MSSSAALVNTSVLSSDIYQLYENAGKPGVEIVSFGEAVYRLPIPWLCCFRQQDLHTVTIPMDDYEPGADSVAFPLPCVSVAQALVNLGEARSLMDKIAGSADIARDYFDEMVYYLKALPLPYLTIDPIEVLFMGDIDEARADIVAALSGTPDAIPYLKRLSGFEGDTKPHALAVLMSGTGSGRGNTNAVAMSSNASEFYWRLPDGQEQPKHSFTWFTPVQGGTRTEDSADDPRAPSADHRSGGVNFSDWLKKLMGK